VDEQGYTAADILKAFGGDTTAQSAIKEIVVAAVAEALAKDGGHSKKNKWQKKIL